jgi:transcriptional regulator with XRE-family HTH domain
MPVSVPVEIVTAKIERNCLKQALKAHGLTQEEVSRRVGISYRQMNRLVLGHSEPSLLLAARIAVVLGESIEALFKIKITTRKRVSRVIGHPAEAEADAATV